MLPRGFRCVGLMLKAALLVLPEDDGPDSRETKGALRTAWREFQAFQARSPIWRLALMAVLYTVGFMVVRLLLRSEEHTSELQSRGHLVCRLLLEKKKKRSRSCGVIAMQTV